MIYCVEDDAGIRDIEVYTLRSTGFEAEGFADGKSFFEALKTKKPELVILDVMLPGDDGLSILKKLRVNAATRELPVIMATAKGAEYDRITGLDLGSDDYLVKPFGMMEMVSRVRAVLRRAAPGEMRPLRVGGLVMNPAEYNVTADGEQVVLTLKEFEMLRAFMSHPGMVFDRDRLLSDIWGMDYDGETRTVDVHVRTLRRKLGRCGELVETVRGVGYRIKAESV
jgi:two-component system alkaline phosphatase synthesis response regulator PhoP